MNFNGFDLMIVSLALTGTILFVTWLKLRFRRKEFQRVMKMIQDQQTEYERKQDQDWVAFRKRVEGARNDFE